MTEIRDLEIIKNALNERYKKYYYLAQNYEKELNEIRNNPMTVVGVENKEVCPLRSLESMISNNQLKEHVAVVFPFTLGIREKDKPFNT
jgi:hypothetical protein